MSILDRFRKKETKERLEKIQKPGLGRSSSESKKTTAKTAGGSELTESKKEEKKPAPENKGEKKAEEKPKEEKKLRTVSERAYRSIIRPIVTEKTVQQNTTYVFAVDPSVNKQEIKRAILELYGVKPVAVRVQNRSGKHVRYGRHQGRLKDWKKAIVQLKPGETIHVIEGL